MVQVKNELKARRLKVTSIGFYRNMLEPDERLRQLEADRLQRVIEIAAETFETNLIGVFAGRHPDLTLEENLPLFEKVWQPFILRAEKLDVYLAFENCTMYRGYPVKGINLTYCPKAYTEIFQRIQSDHIGIEFDPSHCIKQYIDPMKFLQLFEGKIFHVHLKDHERLAEEEFLYGCFDVRSSRDRFPGYGTVAFESIFSELRRQNYQGPLTIEAEREPLATDEDHRYKLLQNSCEYLRSLL